MASNLLNLRLLANSCSSLVMTDEDGETKRLSGMSTGSDNNSEHPPQVCSVASATSTVWPVQLVQCGRCN